MWQAFTWIMISAGAHTEGPGSSGTTGGKFLTADDTLV